MRARSQVRQPLENHSARSSWNATRGASSVRGTSAGSEVGPSGSSLTSAIGRSSSSSRVKIISVSADRCSTGPSRPRCTRHHEGENTESDDPSRRHESSPTPLCCTPSASLQPYDAVEGWRDSGTRFCSTRGATKWILSCHYGPGDRSSPPALSQHLVSLPTFREVLPGRLPARPSPAASARSILPAG